MSTTGTPWPHGGSAPAAPCLLVPIEVQALPLTSPAYLGDWSWAPPSYANLGRLQPVDAAPFSTQAPWVPGCTPPFVGNVVSWALPDALTQGTERDGHVTYPDTPNRWLVVRRAPTATRAHWAYRAWIVASDYRDGPLGSPWPNPTATGAARLGMSWPVEEWPGEEELSGHALDPPLTAVGAADTTFAAFVPNVLNVFALADPLTEVPAGPVTYTVLGWYAGQALDPLLGTAQYGSEGWKTVAQWQDLMKRLRWSVGDGHDLADSVLAAASWAAAHGQQADPDQPRTCYPARTLCHGSTQHVDWQGPDAAFRSGVPTSNPNLPTYRAPRVAVAHNTSDAFTALLARTEIEHGLNPAGVEDLTEILDAFQLGDLTVLDLADGPTQVAVQNQRAWYEHTNGGTRWTVIDPRDDDAPPGRLSGPPLSTDQASHLTRANTAQQHLDDTSATLASLQWQRYALWWKQQRLPKIIPPPARREQWTAAVREAIASLDPQIASQVLAFRWWRRQRDEAIVQLVQDLAPLTLAAQTQPPFQRPNDPVILMSGAVRAFRHGADGRYETEEVLRCRFTGQAVSGMTVRVGERTIQVTGSGLPPTPPTGPDLPPESQDLLVESVMVDLDSAPLIAVNAATTAGTDDPWTLLAPIRHAQASTRPQTKDMLGEPARLVFQYGHGSLPSPVAHLRWQPPWAPLFVDWLFEYAPGAAEQQHTLDPWQFPGTGSPAASLTYRWTAGPVPMSRRLSSHGRTLLTPQSGEVLAARLDRYVADHEGDPTAGADLWALTDAAAVLRRTDLLSQAATGFNLSLLQRDPSTFSLPSDHSLDPFLEPVGAPRLGPDSFPVPGAPGADPSPFNPIRAGHAKLTRLWVVDAFGQVFRILDEHGGALPPGTAPQLAPDLVTPGDPSLAEFKPRLSQFARLRLRLLCADDDTAPVGTVTDADPVCGWVIPNRLEHSLLCFAADGQPVGGLMMSDGNATWYPTPTHSPPPHGRATVQIDNPHLRGLVNGVLLAGAQSGAALESLFTLIDSAQWTIDPTSGWGDEELPALVGRPLAVVRAEVGLDVQGLPARSQAWDEPATSTTGAYDQIPFPVQLGSADLLDDGLVGYYLNDDYRQIQTVHKAPAGPYIGSTRPAPAVGHTALLTLLMDPRGTVHATSGILPVTTVELPEQYSTPALSTMALLIRCGPVLSDAAAPSLPVPALDHGTWSWVQYHDPLRPARRSALAPADLTAALRDSPVLIRDGWLELLLADPPTALTYAVRPGTVGASVTPGNPAVTQLEITAYNGTQEAVRCDQITLQVPFGTGAEDLTADPATIVATVDKTSPWQIRDEGEGTFVATPVGDRTVPAGQTLTFTLSGVQVSTAPGMAAIQVHELTDTHRATSIAIGKATTRPASQLVYTLTPNKIAVAPGDPLTVTVTGYNGGAGTVLLTRVVIVVPVGPGDEALSPTADGMRLVAAAGTDWVVTCQTPGTFICQPAGSPSPLEPGESLVFTLGPVVRPRTPGRALVGVVEAGAAQVSLSIVVTKTEPSPAGRDPRPRRATTKTEAGP